MNDTPVESNHSLYFWKAYILTELEYNQQVKENELAAWGYAEADTTRQNKMTVWSDWNRSLVRTPPPPANDEDSQLYS